MPDNMNDLTAHFESKTVLPCGGERCEIKKAWNNPHQKISTAGRPPGAVAAPGTLMRELAGDLYTRLYPWQFRLLHLLPSQQRARQDPARCELLVAKINEGDKAGLQINGDLVAYDAISSPWGRPDFTTRIECKTESWGRPPYILPKHYATFDTLSLVDISGSTRSAHGRITHHDNALHKTVHLPPETTASRGHGQ